MTHKITLEEIREVLLRKQPDEMAEMVTRIDAELTAPIKSWPRVPREMMERVYEAGYAAALGNVPQLDYDAIAAKYDVKMEG